MHVDPVFQSRWFLFVALFMLAHSIMIISHANMAADSPALIWIDMAVVFAAVFIGTNAFLTAQIMRKEAQQ